MQFLLSTRVWCIGAASNLGNERRGERLPGLLNFAAAPDGRLEGFTVTKPDTIH